jgi:hypothetical protein
MNELIVISYTYQNLEKMRILRKALIQGGFKVWNDEYTQGTPNSSYWHEKAERAISSGNLVLALITVSDISALKLRLEVQAAHEQGIPIVPVLFEDGEIPPAIANNWIVFSSDDKYESAFKKLFSLLPKIFSRRPKSNYQIVQDELLALRESFPKLMWIRIMTLETLAIPVYDYDAVDLPEELKPDDEGDKLAPYSTASLSLGERISQTLNLGLFQFTVISGVGGTHVFLPIANGEKWCMGLGFKSPISIDKVLDYFRQRNFLAEIESLIHRID